MFMSAPDVLHEHVAYTSELRRRCTVRFYRNLGNDLRTSKYTLSLSFFELCMSHVDGGDCTNLE